MNREELQQYIGVTGYSLGQVEKDYFQHIVLSALSRNAGSLLVFKGGTALQKIGVTPRFSEDVDFTARNQISADRLFDITKHAIRNYNIPADVNNIVENEHTLSFRIKIHGPLYKNQRGICTIRVEISKREIVILKPQRKEFTPPYSDILPYTIDIMHNEEMLAEKIRALYTRQKARDLYDVYKILERGIRFNRDVVNQKLTYYHLTFDPSKLLVRCEHIKPLWEHELRSLMEQIPSYERAINAVHSMLSTE